jgi:hypothetical protein
VPNHSNDSTKAKVRYWWKIYRVLLATLELRHALGLQAKWPDIRAHYQSWGDVAAMSYDEWWSTHHMLFLDESPSVREIMTSHFKRNPHCLYVELNLNSRTADLISEVRDLVRTKQRPLEGGKIKKQKKTALRFTQGAEIRPKAYEAYIPFLEEVYAPNCWLPPIKLREFAQRQVQGSIQKFPSLHLGSHEDGKAIAYVSIKRYRDKVRRLCLAVARGEFPGSA